MWPTNSWIIFLYSLEYWLTSVLYKYLVNSVQNQARSTNWHSAIDRSIAIDLATPDFYFWKQGATLANFMLCYQRTFCLVFALLLVATIRMYYCSLEHRRSQGGAKWVMAPKWRKYDVSLWVFLWIHEENVDMLSDPLEPPYNGRAFGTSPKVDLWRHTIVTEHCPPSEILCVRHWQQRCSIGGHHCRL